MLRHKFFVVLPTLLLLLMFPRSAWAQGTAQYSWERFVDKYTAYCEEDEDTEFDGVSALLIDELEEIHNNRISINTASRDELEALHFLSDEQIDSLLAKRDRYRDGFRSLGELMTVRQLSYRERAWLSLFLSFELKPAEPVPDSLLHVWEGTSLRRLTPDSTNRWTGGHYEVNATMQLPLNRKAGFYDYDADNSYSRMFTGYNFAHTLRFRYNWKHRVMYGVTVQEDVGERFGAYGGKPWDYQSLYFFYKSDPERTAMRTFNRYTIVVGDYKASIGQGLLIARYGWNTSATLLGGMRAETTLLASNTGCDEAHFLRGAGGTVRLGRRGEWSASAFASWRKLDGTLQKTKGSDGAEILTDTITSWKTDGLHRTFQEIDKRGVANQYLGGARLGYDNSWISLGVNAVWMHYDKFYQAASRAYNKYYMSGRDAGGVSVDYTLRFKNWSLQGEAAVDRLGHLAETAVLRWNPKNALRFVLQQRSLSKAYVSPMGRIVQGGSQLQNEQGVFLGFRYSGIRRLEIEGSADLAFHQQPVYRADTTSHRLAAQLQLHYHSGTEWSHSLRYSVRSREQNVTNYSSIPALQGRGDVLLSWRSTQRLRYETMWSPSRSFRVSAGAEGALYFSQGSSFDKKTNTIAGYGNSLGGILYARVYGTVAKALTLKTMLAAFASDDYNARTFASTPQLAGIVVIPSFYGTGVFGSLLAEWRFWKNFYVGGSISVTRFTDREQSGSGVNLIDSPLKADAALQLRWKM